MNEQRTSNFIIVGAGIAILFALVTWFSTSSSISEKTIAENEAQTVEMEQKTILVNSTEAPEEVVEEIIVVADELVEKAQEAADRNEGNENAKTASQE
jgi:purine-nucleoside phosphorylase